MSVRLSLPAMVHWCGSGSPQATPLLHVHVTCSHLTQSSLSTAGGNGIIILTFCTSNDYLPWHRSKSRGLGRKTGTHNEIGLSHGCVFPHNGLAGGKPAMDN